MSVTISGMRSVSTIPVPNGGTGNSSFNSGSLLIGNGADSIGVLNAGADGHVLTSISGAWVVTASAGGVVNGAASGGSADNITLTFTGSSGFAIGNIVALSGSLVLADYSNQKTCNAIGAVTEVSGTDVTVALIGEVIATSASLITDIGQELWVGPSGSVTTYSNIPAGKFATQVGYKSVDNNKLILQLRVFGQKA